MYRQWTNGRVLGNSEERAIKRFTDRDTLEKMIEDYIDYYNNKRLQRNLGILTPMEKYEIYLQAA